MNEQRSTVWIYALKRWEKFDYTEESCGDDYDCWGSLVTPWGIVRFTASETHEAAHICFEIVQNGALHRLDIDAQLRERQIKATALSFAQRVGEGSL